MWWAPRWGLPIIRDHLLKNTRPGPARNSKSLESSSQLAKPIHKAANLVSYKAQGALGKEVVL